MSDLRAAIEAWADSEPLIVHGIRRDMAQTPYGRGGELRFLPATSGHGMSGCPGDNLVAWLDDLRAILATPAPDTDALAERPVNQWAHVLDDMGSADFYDTEQDARQMRDLCGGGVDRVETYPVVPLGPAATPTQPAEPTQSDAGEVGR